MEKMCTVPLPIHFNCWKHHAGFIKRQIKHIISGNDIEKLKSSLLKIGDSQMDLYLGRFSPLEIANQTITMLKAEKISSIEQFEHWLSEDAKKYQRIELKDNSIWVIRLGKNPQRFIHIHPGRYSPNTIRVKALTLKTAIFILSIKQLDTLGRIETQSVNDIRKRYLNEPPLKSFSKASGLGRMIQLLSK